MIESAQNGTNNISDQEIKEEVDTIMFEVSPNDNRKIEGRESNEVLARPRSSIKEPRLLFVKMTELIKFLNILSKRIGSDTLPALRKKGSHLIQLNCNICIIISQYVHCWTTPLT